MSYDYQRLRAAAVDERTHNIFHRQTQLERLGTALVARVDDLSQALAADTEHSRAEIAVELHASIAAVRSDYASLDPTQAHEEEYSIASAKDAPKTRRPYGIVYIESSSHTPLFSSIVPLSAAIAAGNCVLLSSPSSDSQVSKLLAQLLPSALDHDTFAFASSPLQDKKLLSQVAIVDQNGKTSASSGRSIISEPHRPVVAVVDRTADLNLAAKELLSARCAFGGQSPYAPDIVLVNEYKKVEFLQALVGESKSYADLIAPTKENTLSTSIESWLHDIKGVRVVYRQEKLAVVELSSSSTSRLSTLQKLSLPIILIQSVSSLDDAIDYINHAVSSQDLLAGYFFSNYPSGKYLAQFTRASASFVNHVPRELLLGPAHPSSYPVDLQKRYSSDAFTIPHPAYCQPTRSGLAAAEALVNSASAAKLLAEAKSPFSIKKRSQGGAVGFFEQGFLFSAGFILVAAVSVTTASVFYLRRYRS